MQACTREFARPHTCARAHTHACTHTHTHTHAHTHDGNRKQSTTKQQSCATRNLLRNCRAAPFFVVREEEEPSNRFATDRVTTSRALQSKTAIAEFLQLPHPPPPTAPQSNYLQECRASSITVRCPHPTRYICTYTLQKPTTNAHTHRHTCTHAHMHTPMQTHTPRHEQWLYLCKFLTQTTQTKYACLAAETGVKQQQK